MRVFIVAVFVVCGPMMAHAQGIRCSAFLHQRDGSWRAFQDGTVIGPDGPIHLRSGERFSVMERSEKGGLARALNSLCEGE